MTVHSVGKDSSLSSNALKLLQQQCDYAKRKDRIMTVDEKDCLECTELLESLTIELVSDSITPIDRSPIFARRFLNLNCIGYGAFGLVFYAEELTGYPTLPTRTVAIKILRPSKLSVIKSNERFDNEAEILSQVRHRNIVCFRGKGEVRSVPYFVLDWADQGSLASRIANAPTAFSPRQAAWLVRGIAEGLHQAHSHNVLHRDLKPGNILLRSTGAESIEQLDFEPLLSDFGLSKNLDTSDAVPLTSQGEILGTLTYMSPEQVQGRTLVPSSDLFSLGVILYELVYGHHPFREQGYYKTLENIVQHAPKYPSHRVDADGSQRKIPQSIGWIIKKCLEKEPLQRYRSGNELAEDLQRFLDGIPVSVASTTRRQSLYRFVVKNFKAIGTTILAIVTLLVLAPQFIARQSSKEWKVQSAVESYGTGAHQFQMEFVIIGNPNNTSDATGTPNPAGSVGYEYGISKYEVSEDMIHKFNASQSLKITMDQRGLNKPATHVNWNEAARFVNWLNISQGKFPAYKFVSNSINANITLWTDLDKLDYDPINPYRSKRATYALPTCDEWYKAAYYDPIANLYYDFPSGDDSIPHPVQNGTANKTAVYNQAREQGPADVNQAGGESPYGVVGLGGNVFEWEESSYDTQNRSVDSRRGIRGGHWFDANFGLSSAIRSKPLPYEQYDFVGFRVVRIQGSKKVP